MYELALRYERPGADRRARRRRAVPSPIGLSILENRPDKNPVISQHSTLYLPIPRYEPGTPTTYPAGGGVSARRQGHRVRARSGTRARRSSTARRCAARPFFGDNKPPRMANFVVGARRHAAHRSALRRAVGARRLRRRKRGARPDARRSHATLAQVEGEWAFGYTRIAGEFLWTARELATGDATRRRRLDRGHADAEPARVRGRALRRSVDASGRASPISADRHEPYRRARSDRRLPR